jgi:prophage antirepressor-like protein
VQKEKYMAEHKIALFQGKKVRKIIHENEWWFSVIDVIEALTDSQNARRYWTDMKRRLAEKEGFYEVYAKCVQLKLSATDGKLRETDCANTESLFRIIQSIPSAKAEPFKRWRKRSKNRILPPGKKES